MYVAYDRPGRHEAFVRCWYSVGPQSVELDRRCTGVGWRWVASVVGGGPALNRHWACFSCLLGDQMTKKIDFELSYYREYNQIILHLFFNSY